MLDSSSSNAPRARLRNLSGCMTGGLAGWSFWHYASDFTLAEVGNPRFFEDAVDQFRVGDFLAVSAKDGGALLYIKDVRPGVVATEPMAAALSGSPTVRGVALPAFLNLYRKLRYLEQADVGLRGDAWVAFRGDPMGFLIRADAEIAGRIWDALVGEGKPHG